MKRVFHPVLWIFLLFLLMFISFACSGLTRGKEAGEKAVAIFNEQFNQERYSEIYQQSSPEFKEAVTEEQLVELLSAVKRKLGSVTGAEQVNWRVNMHTSGTVISLIYDVDFSEGKGTEQFEFMMNGDDAKLLNFNVNSPLLITR